MSDNIPFEIQMEIIKRLPVEPLIQFRSVSKQWKSFIDSSDFIKGYGAPHTQPHSFILSLSLGSEDRFICLVDDDSNGTIKVQQQDFAPFVMSPLLNFKSNYFSYVVGACHGLLCLYGFHNVYKKWMLVIWNPSIGKSFGIANAKVFKANNFGFGVCPVTSDPTVVMVICAHNKPWHVEVFTLSSGVWNVIPSGNLPRQSIMLNSSTHVVVDRFIYWGAREKTFTEDGESTINHMVVSFDLITKEFQVVDLPDTLTNRLLCHVSVSKLRESLVVYGCIKIEGVEFCDVWVMENDSSFRKLFKIGTQVVQIVGFKKNGETIFETVKEDEMNTTLVAYDPCSHQIKNLGISGAEGSFFMRCYKESLLLLDHSDLHIYSDDN